MTEQEQTVALYTWAGWKNIRDDGRHLAGIPPDRDGHSFYELPDISSLDVLAGFEGKLNPILPLAWKYNAELFKAATGMPLSSAVNRPEAIFRTLTATASSRREAMLKALGLWITDEAGDQKPYTPKAKREQTTGHD